MSMFPIKTFTRVLITADVAGANGRVYPLAVLQKACEDAQEKVKAKTMLGYGTGAPEVYVKPTEATHVVTALWMEGPKLIATIEFLDTPKGEALTAYMDAVSVFDENTIVATHCSLVAEGVGTVRHEGGPEFVDTYELKTVSIGSPPPPPAEDWQNMSGLMPPSTEVMTAHVRAENNELNRLFSTQHARVQEATQLWREETKEFLTRPDLGKLVQWLLDRAATAQKLNADLLGQLTEVQKVALAAMHEFKPGSDASKAFSGVVAFADTSSRTPSALFEENQKLKAAIRNHAFQKGDDRCWRDDEVLYGTAGIDLDETNTALPPKEEFLANCQRYHECRQNPQDKYLTVAEQKTELILKMLTIVREQPYTADTNIGKRQQWVKDEITKKVEALKERP